MLSRVSKCTVNNQGSYLRFCNATVFKKSIAASITQYGQIGLMVAMHQPGHLYSCCVPKMFDDNNPP